MPNERIARLRLMGAGALGAFSVVGISGGHGWWEIPQLVLFVYFMTDFIWDLPAAVRRGRFKRRRRTDV